LRGTAANPDTERTVVDTTRCPYPGAKAFDESDAPFFLGRKAEVGALAAALGVRSWLAIRGASGVGKTSLVRAGLFPRLRTGFIAGSDDWPLEYLDLADADGQARLQALAAQPPQGLLCVDHLDGVLHQGAVEAALTSLMAAADAGSLRLILIWRAAPLALLAAAARAAWERARGAAVRDPKHPVYDGLAALSLPPLWERLNAAGACFDLGPMNESERKPMLEKSAARAGRALEPGLADRLLKDACQPDFQLPLLALAMLRLWQRQVRFFLRNEDYERSEARSDSGPAAGGMEGLFVEQLAAACAGFDGAPLDAARAMFMRLVDQNVAGELEPHALEWVQAASAPVLADQGADVAERLVRAGVLRVANTGTSVQLDLAHRLPAGAWRRYHEWRTAAPWASDAQVLLYYLRMWLKAERADSALLYLDYAALQASMQRALAQNPQVFSELERAYVERSLQVRQSRRRARLGLLSTLAVMAGLAGVGWWQGHAARTETLDVERIARQNQQLAAEKDSDAAIARSNLSYAAAKAAELDDALKTNDHARAQQALGALRDIASKTAVSSTIGGASPSREQRVYLHIQREDDRNAARRLAARLAREGYAVQGIQVVSGATRGDIRFRHEDEQDAERVRVLVERWASERGTRMNIAPMDISSNPRAQPGVIEIWLPPLPAAPKLDDRGQYVSQQP
ncbi:MAG: ATP-binding protein, partial [Rhodocyclaceae bacterium]|nr:ATP-binding protein [Rhodocyclaceae bacterium]